jgi:hypothetical protein
LDDFPDHLDIYLVGQAYLDGYDSWLEFEDFEPNASVPQGLDPSYIEVKKIRLDKDGYDSRGGYFGRGDPVYCITYDDGDNIFYTFERARSSKQAVLQATPYLNRKLMHTKDK